MAMLRILLQYTVSVYPGGGAIRGLTVQSLVSKDSGYLSTATFKGLSIGPGKLTKHSGQQSILPAKSKIMLSVS